MKHRVTLLRKTAGISSWSCLCDDKKYLYDRGYIAMRFAEAHSLKHNAELDTHLDGVPNTPRKTDVLPNRSRGISSHYNQKEQTS
jgi:hypothetical protein